MTHYERMIGIAEATERLAGMMAHDAENNDRSRELRELARIVEEAAKGMTVEEAVAP